MLSKRCSKCGAVKPLFDFYKDRQKSDGHSRRCKLCINEYFEAYRKEKAEQIKAYQAVYTKTDQGKAAHKKATQRSKQKHPHRIAARSAINNAIISGAVKRQPCFCCGSEDSQAHHADYENYLGVTWLCAQHHRQAHKEHRQYQKECAK
jgi:hypothetical protein